MRLWTLIVLFCLGTSGATFDDVQPIDEITKNRLHSVVDGQDVRGEGFVAFVEYVRAWNDGRSEFQNPRLSSLKNSPQEYRGEFFTVSGIIELIEPLPAPWEGIEEIFVQDTSGDVFGVYVVGLTHMKRKQSIEAPAVFYKTMSMRDGTGQLRLYPMFITSEHLITTSVLEQQVSYALMAFLILGAVACSMFVIIKMNSRKKRYSRQHKVVVQDVIEAAGEIASELPTNSSEALAEMYSCSKGEQ